VRRETDVDRQHPQLLQKLEEPVLGRDRQRHDKQIDARHAAELDQLGDGTEPRVAGDDRRRAIVMAIVEDAADVDVVARLGLESVDQQLGRPAAADDHCPPFEPPVGRPAAQGGGKPGAEEDEGGKTRNVPGREPIAREGFPDPGQKGRDGDRAEDQRPGSEHAPGLRQPGAVERRNRIAAGELDEDNREQRSADDRHGVPGVEAGFG